MDEPENSDLSILTRTLINQPDLFEMYGNLQIHFTKYKQYLTHSYRRSLIYQKSKVNFTKVACFYMNLPILFIRILAYIILHFPPCIQ